MKRILLYVATLALIIAAIGVMKDPRSFLNAGTSASTPTPQQSHTFHFSLNVQQQPQPQGQHSVLGRPSISADYINRELAVHASPAAGTGQALYDLGVQYGIDPAWALAFFWYESHYGTSGEATVTRSLGNERCVPDRLCNAARYAVFTSWVDGYAHWYSLILVGYVQGQVTISIVGHVCPTIEQIIPAYASGNSQDYINSLLASVARYRAESGAQS